jgi:uncharacterized integral membrane protein
MKAVRGLIWLALLAILVGLVGFVVQNPAEKVDIHLYQTTYVDVPLVLALFAAFVAGLVLTLVFGSYFLLEQSLATRRIRHEKRALERELDALRNLAVEDSSPGRPAVASPARTGGAAPAVPAKREEQGAVWERLW